MVTLSACQPLVPAPAPQPLPELPTEAPATSPEPRKSELDTLLQYYTNVRRMPAAALSREQDSLRSQLLDAPTPLLRAQMAIILSLPNNPGRDYGRALAVIDPLIKEATSRSGSSNGLHQLAQLLQGLILESRRLESENRKLDDNLQNTAQKLKDEQKQSEALQRKLEQLKSIEKALLERNLPQPQAPKTPPGKKPEDAPK
jgi:hypothetical protein